MKSQKTIIFILAIFLFGYCAETQVQKKQETEAPKYDEETLKKIGLDKKLREAINQKSYADIDKALSEGADINFGHPGGGFYNYPIMNASRACHPEMIRYLVKKGARLDVRNSEGMTPLLVAAEPSISCSLPTIKTYLELGSNINAKQKHGYTVLLYKAHEPKIVSYLKSKGADIHLKDNDGNTALMFAAFFRQSVESVQLLLRYGAKINDINKEGKTALGGVLDSINNKEYPPEPEELDNLKKIETILRKAGAK
ncbi:MAG: ankyrin repeat domain-containing protein [Spirochaetia bacterium]|nr:ankyrin repeat domain-containing protein [Spirochaetia bacterium]